jgi:two-component system, NtrC family, nitrogen regulation response regulator GlnG
MDQLSEPRRDEPPLELYPGLASLQQRISSVARVQRTTLIFGPTGAGKEVVARTLHGHSSRRDSPFVAVHCAALPDTLVETELFGHSRGAFTGAVQTRGGLIRSAHHGTLFLDEIDSMSLASQAKLLRFVESGEYRAIGSDRLERSDAWILAATNQNLRARVREGTFREDLLYRLEVVRIDVPALAKRRSDIALLAGHFLAQVGCQGKHFSPAAQQALEGHDWPGNVRELKHRIESAALLTDGEVIEVETLGFAPGVVVRGACSAPSDDSSAAAAATGPDQPQESATAALDRGLWRLMQERSLTLSEATATCERLLVNAALRAEGNNRTRAAGRLGINVRTIYKKMSGRDPAGE